MREDIAVLLLIYRRPHLTRRVLERLRDARPSILLVAGDAPKGPGDLSLCQETRDLVAAEVDWPCHVRVRYAATHLGCGKAVSSALDWAFSLHEQVIVLEDDCLPEPSFFPFCAELLERYAHDQRVMQISGSNLAEVSPEGMSYYFSRLVGPIWGWASWRRAWQAYDFEMTSWPQERHGGPWLSQCRLPFEAAWRRELFDEVFHRRLDTWDYQWVYAKMRRGGLNIIPSRHLVANIGFGAEATHTRAADDPRGRIPTGKMPFPLSHPPAVANWEEAGRVYLREVVGLPPSSWTAAGWLHRAKTWARSLKRRIRS